ncbi:MAG: class I SAM-dependent DNA methyltransferase [Microcystis flos-aquae DF17]|nr:MAG: class I SAM-dependent DNA methyltransferase [Microcystis flos-aquae DF17]
MNPVEIEEAVSELAREPFDRAEFPFQFLRAFDNADTTIRRLRSGSTNQSDIPGGVLQRNNIHIATCNVGAVDATLKALRESPKTTSAKAKFILATDGETFQAEDLNEGGTVACSYAEFPDHFALFLPLAGITTVREIRESSFDVKATGRLNRLYVQLLKENPDWAKADRQHDMNHFMARLIFCFFAEDTDILLIEGLFTTTVEQMTAGDSANTHAVIGEIFRAMDTKPAEREAAGIPRYAAKFPYVNGQLFSGSIDVPRFSKVARSYLLHIGSLNWRKINPDIFGSMIQAVTDDEERGSLGMHYTSVPNILKVLNPLFLDDLREQLEEAGTNGRKLLNLRNRMARIRVFDPACGSGNFLVIAYKAMREIEFEINKRRGEPDRRTDIPLTNFRGIELRDFPAEIARLALIIAEYQCDVLYRGQKEAIAEFLPLGSENWITCGNALRLDWLSICPPTGTGVKVTSDDLFQTPLDQAEIDFENEGGETYICGNPPYLGAKKKSDEQKSDMSALGLPQSIDYVTAFFAKATHYMERSRSAVALVTTSSICQGEQVSDFWPKILKSARISFGYRPFKWANSAANNAGVFCSIIGLADKTISRARLYDGTTVKECTSISPYLIEGAAVVCEPSRDPISDVAKMIMGSNPVDGRRLVMDREEGREIVEAHAQAAKFIKQYYGTKELVNGCPRFCLWIPDADQEEAASIPPIAKRIKSCAEYRRTAGRDAQKTADRPHSFCYRTYQNAPHLNIGKVIGEKFSFVPLDLRPAGSVTSVDALCIYGVKLTEFSIIASTMHMVWAEAVSGRMGNGIRYGATVVYNTFPVPKLTDQNRADLTQAAEAILLAREAHFPATIADLYDPDTMPEDLRRAHEANDEVLERIYIGRRFRNDTERLEKLFELYTRMTGAKAAA